jgi:hypothetical protein
LTWLPNDGVLMRGTPGASLTVLTKKSQAGVEYGPKVNWSLARTRQ